MTHIFTIKNLVNNVLVTQIMNLVPCVLRLVSCVF